MLTNIVESHLATDYWYELTYDDGHGNGFGFPCDENGDLAELAPEALANLEYCRAHPDKFVRAGKIVRFSHTYREPATGTCDCGETVTLVNEYMGACECPKCGQWYNLFGQELLPPDKWDRDEMDYDY